MAQFTFKFCDAIPYEKNGVRKYRIIAYCDFGFTITLFTTSEKAKVILEHIEKTKSNIITDFVKVTYDISKQQFAYYINIK